MYSLKNYVQVQSLEEAYALRQQSRNNVILGGSLWMKMGSAKYDTGIDLCQLALDQIEETDEEFKIGCMCTLRDLEVHASLNETFNHIFKEGLKHIVGIQFRNTATVGGSLFPRYAFSDVLTVFAALDTYVELYKGGIVPLTQFINMRMDTDLLVSVIVKKDGRKASYQSVRLTETDFAIINCALSKKNDLYTVVLGSTPSKAKIVENVQLTCEEDIDQVIAQYRFGSNHRGSAEYRQVVAKVLIKRAMEEVAS